MKKTIITIVVLLGLAGIAGAQQPHFTTSGTIEYERKTNVFAMIKSITDKEKKNDAVWVQIGRAHV